MRWVRCAYEITAPSAPTLDPNPLRLGRSDNAGSGESSCIEEDDLPATARTGGAAELSTAVRNPAAPKPRIPLAKTNHFEK